MTKKPGSGPFDFEKLGEQWKLITLRAIGTVGAVGFLIQVIIFPIIGNPTNGTACQWCLVAGMGLPIAGLLKGSQKE